jgi:integrase
MIEPRTSSSGVVTYRVRVRLKGHPQVSETHKRLTDARKREKEIETEIRQGRYFKTLESQKHDLHDAIERYRQELLSSLKDPQHRLLHLDWWDEEIGHVTLADLTPATIAECRDRLKRTPSNYGKHKGKSRTAATVNRYLASLSPVLSAAVMEWGWMDSNPCKKVKRGKESSGRVRFLSPAERTALLAACAEMRTVPELNVIVLIAMITGARRGEIMGLCWRHVDMTRGRLILEDTKNGENRSVPLVGPALKAVEDWAKVRPLDSNELVFPGRGERSKNKPLDFEIAWHDVLGISGVTDFRFHDLRHTAASYLAMNGAGLREIGDILGHKTLAMVQRYSHLCDDHKQATMERMALAEFGDTTQ